MEQKKKEKGKNTKEKLPTATFRFSVSTSSVGSLTQCTLKRNNPSQKNPQQNPTKQQQKKLMRSLFSECESKVSLNNTKDSIHFLITLHKAKQNTFLYAAYTSSPFWYHETMPSLVISERQCILIGLASVNNIKSTNW